MPRKSPYNIELHDEEAAELQHRGKTPTIPLPERYISEMH